MYLEYIMCVIFDFLFSFLAHGKMNAMTWIHVGVISILGILKSSAAAVILWRKSVFYICKAMEDNNKRRNMKLNVQNWESSLKELDLTSLIGTASFDWCVKGWW